MPKSIMEGVLPLVCQDLDNFMTQCREGELGDANSGAIQAIIQKAQGLKDLFVLELRFVQDIPRRIDTNIEAILNHILSKLPASATVLERDKYVIDLLTVQVVDEASLALALIVERVFEARKQSKEKKEWENAPGLIKKAILKHIPDIDKKSEDTLKLLPILEASVSDYRQKKAQAAAQSAAEEKKKEEGIVSIYQEIDALNTAWEQEQKELEIEKSKKVGEIQARINQGISVTAQLPLNIRTLKEKKKTKHLKATEEKLEGARKTLSQDEADLLKSHGDFESQLIQKRDQYHNTAGGLLEKILEDYKNQLASIKNTLLKVRKFPDFKEISEKIKKLEESFTQLREKGLNVTSILDKASIVQGELAQLKKDKNKAHRQLFVKTLKDKLYAYLGQRAITYKIRDFFSKCFAFFFGWLGYTTEKAKRTTYVSSIFTQLDAFGSINDEADKKKQEMTIQKTLVVNQSIDSGLVFFSPRAKQGPKYEQSMNFILCNAQGLLRDIDQSEPSKTANSNIPK